MKTRVVKEEVTTTTVEGDTSTITQQKQSVVNERALQFTTNAQCWKALSIFLFQNGVAFNVVDNDDFQKFYQIA